MEKLTKQELIWIVDELDRVSAKAEIAIRNEKLSSIERDLLKLRSEQYESISDRLSRAVKNNDKRIEVN